MAPILYICKNLFSPLEEDLKFAEIIYVGFMVTLNCYSAEWTLHINNFMTNAKLAAIAIIIDQCRISLQAD